MKDLKPKIILLFVVLISCSHNRIQIKPIDAEQSTWYWGGNNGRTGFSDADVQPSLQPAWNFSATSVLDKAITASGSYLFFGTQDGMVYILDVQSGKNIRSFDIQQNSGVTCAPDGNQLIIVKRAGKPSLTAVDFVNRDTIWKIDVGPIAGEVLIGDKNIIAVNEKGVVVAVSRSNGNLVWKRKLDLPVYSTPALSGKTVVISADNGMLYALSIDTGEIFWEKTLPEHIVSNPVIQNNKIFIGSREGMFFCISKTDGNILWQFKCDGGVYYAASASSDHVVFGTSRGIIYCLDANQGKEEWHLNTDSVIGTTPLITENWIYFGTLDKMIYGVERNTGKVGWCYKTKGRVKTSPIIWKQMLVVASEDRFVYGFEQIR